MTFRPILLMLMLLLVGCVAPGRTTYEPLAAANAEIDGYQNIRMYADVPWKPSNQRAWLPSGKLKEINYLAISGGGGAGSFTVGALKGWSDLGHRPEFDIVSGVSTGALIAPYAFLGQAYDDTLVDLYTSGVAEELVDADFLPKALLGPSLLKQEPLRRMVEKNLSERVMSKIAAEHRKGRRLFILTTNLDSQRAVIWNMGAIADSRQPSSLRLFQDVLIASASVPGMYPSVMIKVRAKGNVFEEMHSDGGSMSQMLTIPEGWMAAGGTPIWPRGTNVNMYVIINNALMPEFATPRNNTLVVMARASSTLIKAQTRSALLATQSYARENGIRLQVASIDAMVKYNATDPFNTKYMRAIYNLGYAKMSSRAFWKDMPSFTN